MPITSADFSHYIAPSAACSSFDIPEEIPEASSLSFEAALVSNELMAEVTSFGKELVAEAAFELIAAATLV